MLSGVLELLFQLRVQFKTCMIDPGRVYWELWSNLLLDFWSLDLIFFHCQFCLPWYRVEFFFCLRLMFFQSNYMLSLIFGNYISFLFLSKIRVTLISLLVLSLFMLCRSPLLSVYADMSLTCKVKLYFNGFITQTHTCIRMCCKIHARTYAELCPWPWLC